ncbi:hypothetical protein M758_11G028000 [Ceratodon purpureus]|nr:hypothetical protein M758_11G028000 [Ceratodon purpureus]
MEDGAGMELRGEGDGENVICFGSIPVVLDVAQAREGEDEVVREGRRRGRSLGNEEVVSRRRRERRERRKGESVETVMADDRSASLGDGGCVERGEGEGRRSVEGGRGNSGGDGSVGGVVHCEAMDNGGSGGSGSVGDVDCGRGEASAEGESGNAVSGMQKIPRPLPPVLSSVEERSVRLSWVGCAMPVVYELDYASNEVSVASKKSQNASSLGGDLKWTSVSCGEGLSYKLDNLKPGVPYSFRLRVVPVVVPPLAAPQSPPPSDIAVFSTLPAAPSQPSPPVLVSRARTSLKVKWAAPSESGGLPLEYVVEMNPPPGKGDANIALPSTSDGFVQIYNGKETSVKVTRLVPGTIYRFRVLATNSVGRSSFSKDAKYTTDASVPAAPEAPSLLSASATSMTVEWQEPSNSGSPITAYTLEHDDGESGPFTSVYTGEKRQYTMEGLKSGHVYRVRVMAHNEKGKGSFSKPAELLTNFAAPSPPPTPSVTGRSTTSITVSWGPPECDGGSAITAFEVEMKRFNSGWCLIYYGNANTYTVTGLSQGKEIDVRVRAVNLMGKSGWSREAEFSTLPGPPEAPSAPVALDVGSSSIVLGWRSPVHDGGSLIGFFRLEMSDERAQGERRFVTVYSGDKCKFEVDGLDPGSAYCFQVQAVNKLGAGPYSELSILETLPAPPATPEPPVIVGKASPSSISLRWSSPQSNGARIQSYILQMLVRGYGEKYLSGCDENISTSGDDLQGGNFVSLAGQRGHSDSSSPFSDGLPHSPSHSTSSDSSRGTSTWDSEKSSQKNRTSPSYAGTSEDEHDVHGVLYKRGVDGPVSSSHSLDLGLFVNGSHDKMALREVYSGSSTAYTVTKLQPFTSYAFRLQARNSAGTSGFSPFSTIMTSAAAPCAPCPPIVVETTSSSLTLRWEVPEQDNGSPVFRFTLQMLKVISNKENLNGQKTSVKKSAKKKLLKQDASVLTQTTVWDHIFDGSGLGHVISDLLPGQGYTFRVVAHNMLGSSPPSSNVEVTTLSSAPEAPLAPTFSKITPTSVHIKWSSPARDNGMPVTSYKLVMDDGQGGRLRKVYEGSATSHKAVKLQPASSYRVAVQAINSLGASDLSEIAVIELPVAPPPAPPIPKVEISSEEKQAPTMPVNRPKASLRKDLTEMVNSMRQICTKVQQPWSLETRRWITGVGISVTLIAAVVTVL